MNLIIDVKSRNPYNYCNLRKIIYHQYLTMLIGISDQLGARFDRLRYEVFQNLILSPMNTGLLRPAVATVLTVYGIETTSLLRHMTNWSYKLQQSLPFTVLKPEKVYDITTQEKHIQLQQSLPFTVLKHNSIAQLFAAKNQRCNSPYRLRY